MSALLDQVSSAVLFDKSKTTRLTSFPLLQGFGADFTSKDM